MGLDNMALQITGIAVPILFLFIIGAAPSIADRNSYGDTQCRELTQL